MCKIKNIVGLITILAAFGLSGKMWGMNGEKAEQKPTTILGFMNNDIYLLTKLTTTFYDLPTKTEYKQLGTSKLKRVKSDDSACYICPDELSKTIEQHYIKANGNTFSWVLLGNYTDTGFKDAGAKCDLLGPLRKLLKESKTLEQAFKKLGVLNKKERLFILGRWRENNEEIKYRLVVQKIQKNGETSRIVPEKNDVELKKWLQKQDYVECSDNYLLPKAQEVNMPEGYCWDSCKNISYCLDKQLYPAWVPENYAIHPTTLIISNLEKLFNKAQITEINNKVVSKKDELLFILGRWWEDGELKYRFVAKEIEKNGKTSRIVPEKTDIELQTWLKKQNHVEYSDNYLLLKAQEVNMPKGYCWDSCKNISDYLDKQLYPVWVPEDYATNPTPMIMLNLAKLFKKTQK